MKKNINTHFAVRSDSVFCFNIPLKGICQHKQRKTMKYVSLSLMILMILFPEREL